MFRATALGTPAQAKGVNDTLDIVVLVLSIKFIDSSDRILWEMMKESGALPRCGQMPMSQKET